MTSIPGYSRLRDFVAQRVSRDVTPKAAYYVYDAEGRRVGNVTERYHSDGGTPGSGEGAGTSSSRDDSPRKKQRHALPDHG